MRALLRVLVQKDACNFNFMAIIVIIIVGNTSISM